jgi:hypothetical protein
MPHAVGFDNDHYLEEQKKAMRRFAINLTTDPNFAGTHLVAG